VPQILGLEAERDREDLSVSERATQKFRIDKFNPNKLNDVEVTKNVLC
jgi:hypothetical protein